MSGVVNGTNYLLLVNGKYAMLLTGTSLSFENSTRDISCRETNNWNTKVLGMREWVMECEGKYGFSYADGTIDSVHTTGSAPPTTIPAMKLTEIVQMGYFNQERLWLGFVDFTTGSPAWEGFAYLNSVSVDTPNEDSCGITMSFKGCNRPNFTQVSNPGPGEEPSTGNHY